SESTSSPHLQNQLLDCPLTGHGNMTRFLRNHAPFFITTLLTTAWIVTACSKKDEDSESAEGPLGSTCDLEAEGTCEAGLTCSEDTEGNGVCTVGAGQPCDPD